MSGISLSLFEMDDLFLSLLDAPTAAPAWIPSADLSAAAGSNAPSRSLSIEEAAWQQLRFEDSGSYSFHDQGSEGGSGSEAVLAVCRKLMEMEPQLTEFDSICGDGDCGLVLKKGALAVAQYTRTLTERQAGRVGSVGPNFLRIVS